MMRSCVCATAILALVAPSAQLVSAALQDAACENTAAPASLLQKATRRGIEKGGLVQEQPPKCPECAPGQQCYCTLEGCTCIAKGSRGTSPSTPSEPQCPACAEGQQCYCTLNSCTCLDQGSLGASVVANPPQPPQCPKCSAEQECYCTHESCTCIAQNSWGASSGTKPPEPPKCPKCGPEQQCYCTLSGCSCIDLGSLGTRVVTNPSEPPQCPKCALQQECYCTKESCTCIAQGTRGASSVTNPPQAPQCPKCTTDQQCYCTPDSCTCIAQGPDVTRLDSFPAVTGACSGTKAQGRCWHLSETGESCKSTCAKYGRSFSYVVSDPTLPLTPILVGHTPHTKQPPWAALECYVPSEDRFHTANANAAKHHSNYEIGIWTQENCKLACPCGDTDVKDCSWKQPPACAPEFEYKGVTYKGCAAVDSEHQRPWCQHHYQHMDSTPEVPQDWSYCNYTCGSETPTLVKEEGCEWNPASTCVKEFDYEGTHYMGCTSTDHSTPWCANTNPYKGSWNHCTYSCANKSTSVKDDDKTPIKDDDLLCMWQPKHNCSKLFKYKGVEYNGCATVDHPTPWCSYDRLHKGSWAPCTKVCTAASGSGVPAPTPAPAPITESEDPCTRHPEAENDQIGASVTLDEVGYKIAAAADSPINTKRFICRIVDKLNCRVTELSSLMAFVPYYSGLVSHQTYARLESELETLCHAGGKWVVPIEKL